MNIIHFTEMSIVNYTGNDLYDIQVYKNGQ